MIHIVTERNKEPAVDERATGQRRPKMAKRGTFSARRITENNGIELVEMRTRFGGIEYFLENRNVLDEYGLPTVVAQTSDEDEAFDSFRKFAEGRE
jgi:hypothetical protein